MATNYDVVNRRLTRAMGIKIARAAGLVEEPEHHESYLPGDWRTHLFNALHECVKGEPDKSMAHIYASLVEALEGTCHETFEGDLCVEFDELVGYCQNILMGMIYNRG